MQRSVIVLSVLALLSVRTALSQKKEDIINYINTYKELAISEMKRTGVPATIKLAQGIHETNAGTSELVKKSNNHFGIKCKTGWTGSKVYHDDDAAGECFRAYASAADSYRDHSNFLRASPRYAFLFDLDPTDYEGWAYGLKKAGYATNVKYSQILIRIIKENNLEQYTLIALGKMKPEDEKVPALATTEPAAPPSKEVTAPEKIVTVPVVDYPSGEFLINKTKVIFAPPGSSWLSIAEKYEIPLARLLDFNDLKTDEDIAYPGQLIFLQRKRKISEKEFHIVATGETLYDICQKEGIRMESLLELNHLYEGMTPAEGQKLNLLRPAASRPALAERGNGPSGEGDRNQGL